MSTYVAQGEINTVYPQMINEVMHQGSVVKPRGEVTRELHPALMVIDNPRRRLVTSFGRPVNVAFALVEVLWILAGREDVDMLRYYNSNIANYSDDGHRFNAAYGHRLRHAFGHDQLEDVIRTLQDDPDTRQATIVLSDPRADHGWHWESSDQEGVSPGDVVKTVTRDRACNVLSHLMIRDGALDWYQVIRSNDALWGTPYNWMQWTHLQEYAARRLHVPVGRFIHNADSLHVYDKQWAQTPHIRHFDLYTTFDYDHAKMVVEPSTLERMHAFEFEVRRSGSAAVAPTAGEVGEYWRSVALVLRSFAAYKEHDDELALGLLAVDDADPVYGASAMRFYFYNRWYKPEYLHLYREMRAGMSGTVFDWIVDSHA